MRLESSGPGARGRRTGAPSHIPAHSLGADEPPARADPRRELSAPNASAPRRTPAPAHRTTRRQSSYRIDRADSAIAFAALTFVTKFGPVGITSPCAGNNPYRARSARKTIGKYPCK